jgi:hypothetical protein
MILVSGKFSFLQDWDPFTSRTPPPFVGGILNEFFSCKPGPTHLKTWLSGHLVVWGSKARVLNGYCKLFLI